MMLPGVHETVLYIVKTLQLIDDGAILVKLGRAPTTLRSLSLERLLPYFIWTDISRMPEH
jgi:hypothetical protein